jgi:16S rRNA (guanine966-N2)-methyltransferase
VFNWLQFELAGARCLDLFAGSGALGFEALSRGAGEVVFVERDPAAARAIGDMLAQLRCDRGRVEQVDAVGWLERGSPAPQAFDIVFLDPPYSESWLPALAEKLERGGWLAPGAWIYLEDAAVRGEPALPPGWTLHRSKRAGDVGYHLARRGSPAHNNDRQSRGSE